MSAPTARWGWLLEEVGEVGLEIVNDTDRNDTLTAASSPDCDASLHRSTTDDQGMASMDHVDQLEIPAGETIELAPGGLNIMLPGLTTTLEVGDAIELDVTFERGGTQNLQVPVVQIGTTAGEVERGS
jgi:copper(I)-binding protein